MYEYYSTYYSRYYSTLKKPCLHDKMPQCIVVMNHPPKTHATKRANTTTTKRSLLSGLRRRMGKSWLLQVSLLPYSILFRNFKINVSLINVTVNVSCHLLKNLLHSWSLLNTCGTVGGINSSQHHHVPHFTTISALNLDPKNAPAQEGLQKIEQCTGGDGGAGGNTLEVTYGLDEMEDGGMNSDEVLIYNKIFNCICIIY